VRSPPSFAALVALCCAACLPAFDPDLSTDSIARADPLCGVQGGPCCAAPDPACEDDLVCDPEQRQCMREPVLLCRDDAECRQGEVCCMSGFVGTCTRGAKQACPGLDLVAATPELDFDAVQVRSFDPMLESDRCLIDRRCVGGPGPRRLLGLSTIVHNVGAADLLLGSPEDTTGPTVETCDGEPRFAAFLRYELLDSSGPQVQQDVPATCSAGASGQFIAPFDCDFQGIWSGFSQAYASTALDGGPADGCRWLDITDLLPGEYTLRVTVNPDARLPETNFGNNTPTELPLVIPAFGDASARCPEPPNPLLGAWMERECGWARAAFQADGRATPCTPGDYVPLTCRADGVDSVCGDYRMCPGPDICSYEESVPSDNSGCFPSFPPNLYLQCPATGTYSFWLPSEAAEGFSCEPYSDAEFFGVPPAPDAGVPEQP
jgi:hypothetical protein